MKPTQSDLHVNRPLSNIVFAFMQNHDAFVARSVFPVVPTPNKSDLYWSWKREDFWRVSAKKRAPGAPSEGGSFEVETASFNCEPYAVHYDLIDAIVANQDNELNLERGAAEWVALQLLLKREQLFMDTFIQASTWTGSTTGGDLTGVAAGPTSGQFLQWNDQASTPIELIRAQMRSVQAKTSYLPNVLTLGPETWDALVDHPDLIDRIKYTQKGVVTTELLASLLGLEKVVIGTGIKNTAVEGQTGSYSFFHGKYALLTYSAPAPAIMAPSAGYTFCWTGLYGTGSEGQRVKRFYMDEIAAERIEGEMNFQMKVVGPELGVYFATAVA